MGFLESALELTNQILSNLDVYIKDYLTEVMEERLVRVFAKTFYLVLSQQLLRYEKHRSRNAPGLYLQYFPAHIPYFYLDLETNDI